MYLMPPMPPIFHFFLILASAKGSLKLSGPSVLKLVGSKQTKRLRTDLLELMETSYLRLLTYWGVGRAGGIYISVISTVFLQRKRTFLSCLAKTVGENLSGLTHIPIQR